MIEGEYWVYSWWAKMKWYQWNYAGTAEPYGFRPTEEAALHNIRKQAYYADKIRSLLVNYVP